MTVKDIMTRIVFTVSPDSTVENAAQVMKQNDVGLLPVEDDNREIRGVVTDRDITLRVTAEGLNPKETRVGQIMTARSIYCFEDEDMEDACLKMTDTGMRRILVYDRAHSLAGILSLDDVAVKTRKEKLTGHVLRKVAKTA
jgi:CBS domain-containing protein